MLGKVLASIVDMGRKLRGTSPTMAAMLRMTGNGAANPSIVSSYNVTSVVRTGVGVYRVTLTQSTAWGVSLTGSGVLSLAWKIAPIGATDGWAVTADVISATQVDISTYALTVTGSKITRTLTDFIAGDVIHVIALVAAGGSTLPEA